DWLPCFRRRCITAHRPNLGSRETHAILSFPGGERCQDRRRVAVFWMAVCPSRRLGWSGHGTERGLLHGCAPWSRKRPDAISRDGEAVASRIDVSVRALESFRRNARVAQR